MKSIVVGPTLLALCFYLLAGLMAKQAHAGEYYIYRDANRGLVISNQKPPPGSKIIKQQSLPDTSRRRNRAGPRRTAAARRNGHMLNLRCSGCGRMRPRDAKTMVEIESLRSDHIETERAWIFLAGPDKVLIVNQKRGEALTGQVALTHDDFQRFVDWWEGRSQRC